MQNQNENQGTDPAEAVGDELGRLIHLAPAPAFVVGADDRIGAANAAFCRLTGYDAAEITGIKINRIVRQVRSGTEGMNRVVRTANLAARGDASIQTAAGDVVIAEFFCRRFEDGRVLVFAADLTERIEAETIVLEGERKRWQSQRIEALGRLAGGIAHDFNNFLAVLLLHVDILNLQLKDDDPIRERVNEIKSISNSVASTVRQLFAFGRKQPMTLAPVSLGPILREFAESFQRETGRIDVVFDVDPHLGLCFVDQVQITHVLSNLASNARDAMPEGGTLTLAASNILLEPDQSPAVQPPGEYVEVRISDTGQGIEPAAEEHIFEPFFSGVETNKGAGLSLAMVYGIVKQSKGFIWIDNRPGEGTTFKLHFPRIDVSAPAGVPAEEKKAVGITRTVLLVDDEAAVRKITAEFLKMSEFEVLQAGSGMEAIEIAQEHQGPIHLLLTDFTMPFMDGRQVAEKISKMRPETSVLYMSGNIEQVVVEELSTAEKVNFIHKPFSSTSLSDKVRQVLNARDS